MFTPKFKIGDPVNINEEGLIRMCGITTLQQLKDHTSLIISKIDKTPITSDGLFTVEVNHESFNILLLDENMFDLKIRK